MLPHADHAIVDEAKICDYLLSDTHPVGRIQTIQNSLADPRSSQAAKARHCISE
jgi:hypothetical protein